MSHSIARLQVAFISHIFMRAKTKVRCPMLDSTKSICYIFIKAIAHVILYSLVNYSNTCAGNDE